MNTNPLAFLALLMVVALQSACAADAPEGRRARVAGGETVALSVSKQSPAEWADMRPAVDALKPRIRGNQE